MGKLFDKATKRQSLRAAWYRIRSNGIRSSLRETRNAVEHFEQNSEQNISRIQRLLRSGAFLFDPQKGVLKNKSSGSKRGIVMASVHNRIVERALLDCLQEDVAYIQEVICTRTSVGGVPERGVAHGLAIIRDAINSNNKYFIRSDISGFFDNIPRHDVISILSNHITDTIFLDTLVAATTVTLANESALGEDRKVFPSDEEGVAQGSPLSPLFGNILLHEFDKEFNGRGIVCVRFIDDFVMLGEKKVHVRRAFDNAKKTLNRFGLQCHDPFDSKTPITKASCGDIRLGFVFLGYDIRPGLFQASKAARISLLENIGRQIRHGKKYISEVMQAEDSFRHRQRYVQTLDLIDRIIRGWGDAFAYADAKNTVNDLDVKIDNKIREFRGWYGRMMRDMDWRAKRRTGGVCLLEDIEQKSLDLLPFKIDERKRYRKSKNMIVVSTDGSVISTGPRAARDRGAGGWGAIFHSNDIVIGGCAQLVTNNQMELTAVIEALRKTPVGSRVRIRTDSQYVYRAVHEGVVIRTNIELWNIYLELSDERRVDVVWVKGHAGDPYNERADDEANRQAKLASKSMLKSSDKNNTSC